MWTDIRQFDNNDTQRTVDKFFTAVKLVLPVQHDLEAGAMTTRILGITYDAAWRQESSEHVQLT
jgi:hypothetical protein